MIISKYNHCPACKVNFYENIQEIKPGIMVITGGTEAIQPQLPLVTGFSFSCPRCLYVWRETLFEVREDGYRSRVLPDPPFPRHAASAPAPRVAELGVVRRHYPHQVIQCPKCSKWNPDASWLCQCGFEFTGSEPKTFEPKRRLSFGCACALVLAAIVGVITLVYLALAAWFLRGAGH